MTSVTVGYETGSDATSGARCTDDLKDASSISRALDWVMHDVINSGTIGIVNLSLSGADFGPGGSLRSKMLELATPAVGSGYTYKGSFVAQAAGNSNSDACNYAYGNASTNDGIMVVGAVTRDGVRVVPASGDGTNGFNTPDYTTPEPGSNYGSCVEIWAPGQTIWGAWGPTNTNLSNPSSWQDERTTSVYSNYGYVGGTSFAAPHVAAVAAYLLKSQGLVSSVQVEQAVRNSMYTAGYTDNGATMYYPQIP